MRLLSTPGLIGLLTLAACAHTAEQAPEVPVTRAPVPPAEAAPKPVATPGVDPAAELEAALRGTSIYFDFNSDQLKPEGLEALQRVAEVLRKQGAATLVIEGNCDERGTEEYNLMLGQRRAETARKYLTALGVTAKQIETISYGALRPANPGHTEEAWNQNRRDALRAAR